MDRAVFEQVMKRFVDRLAAKFGSELARVMFMRVVNGHASEQERALLFEQHIAALSEFVERGAPIDVSMLRHIGLRCDFDERQDRRVVSIELVRDLPFMAAMVVLEGDVELGTVRRMELN